MDNSHALLLRADDRVESSSVRSALMAAIVLAGLMANRKPVLFNDLCAAGFLILLRIQRAFQSGLSTLVLRFAAIMLFAGPLSSSLAAPFSP